MAKINVRSPYYVYFTASKLESAELSIWIYSGTQTGSRPVTPTYVLNALAVNSTVNFEIAELVKDYMTYEANEYETPPPPPPTAPSAVAPPPSAAAAAATGAGAHLHGCSVPVL